MSDNKEDWEFPTLATHLSSSSYLLGWDKDLNDWANEVVKDGLAAMIGFTDVQGAFNPSQEDFGKLESQAYFKAVDLLCEGPIEGFCDANGVLQYGENISKGIYLDNTPIQLTDPSVLSKWNFRDASCSFVRGFEDQSGIYSGQNPFSNGPDAPFYYLKDFGYSSRTIAKKQHLSPVKTIEGTTLEAYRANHAILDPDIDMLTVSIKVNQSTFMTDEELLTGNNGTIHIWGDITGVFHRSLSQFEPMQEGVGGRYDAFMHISGLATSPYMEDVTFKLRDYSEIKRNRTVYVRNYTKEKDSHRSVFDVSFETVTEITNENLSYPNSAYVTSLINSEDRSNIPVRTFDVKLKKIKVPSNYTESDNAETERHIGSWDGTFKADPEWTDNPAWILYDLITNDRYGLGEYVKAINIDKWQLYKIAKFCDQPVPTSKLADGKTETDVDRFEKERLYSCNLLLQSRMEAFKAIGEIASVFQGMAYFNSNQIFLAQDSPKDHIAEFSNSNVTQGAFQYSGASKQVRFSAVKVAYKDKDDNFLPKYEYVEDPEGIIRFGLIEKEVAAVGCTSRDQALRLGRWVLLTSNKEEEMVRFQTSRQAEHLAPGDIITISDRLRSQFRNGGRVKAIVNDKSTTSENFILLDQQIDTENYGVDAISFILPHADWSGDREAFTKQARTFVHRDGQHKGGNPDLGGVPDFDPSERTKPIRLDNKSSTSDNDTLHNYIENTPSGAKILTHDTEDLILESGISGAYIDESTLTDGFRTLNDYFLSPSSISQLTLNPAQRALNTEKLETGAMYILHATGLNETLNKAARKEFRVVSIESDDMGVYSIAGLEYNRDKFEDVQKLSSVYKSSTFSMLPTIEAPRTDNFSEIDSDITAPVTVKRVLGAPRSNTVKLIVKPEIFVNSEGEYKSKVKYIFHNIFENSAYYHKEQADQGAYALRVQEVTPTYYGTLVGTQSATPPNYDILQNGEYIISGQQECGDYKVLYDNDEEAQFGGNDSIALAVPNWLQGGFGEVNPPGELIRPRLINEVITLNGSGCSPLGYNSVPNKIITDGLSGEFILDNPNAYYELRWREQNKHGSSPEKAMFFRAAKDTTPPGKITSPTVKVLFDNLHFRWKNPGDSDLSAVRLYTGDKDVDHQPLDNDYFLSSSSDFAVFPISKFNREYPGALGGGDVQYFHARAVDFAGNVGESEDFVGDTSLYKNLLTPPDLILSGELRQEDDGRWNSYLVSFYSGDFNNHIDFNHYDLQILKEGESRWYDFQLPKVDAGGGVYQSGRFDFQGVGGAKYYAKIRFADLQGNYSSFTEEFKTLDTDNIAPSTPTWNMGEYQTRRISDGTLFLSWNNPEDADLKHIEVWSGVYENQRKLWKTTSSESEIFTLASEAMDTHPDLEDTVTLDFWLRAVDTSNNKSPYSSKAGLYVDSTNYLSKIPSASVYTDVDVEMDALGDGVARPIIKFMVKEDSIPELWLQDYRAISFYNVQLSRNPSFYPLVDSINLDADIYGDELGQTMSFPTYISGSGHFGNLHANTNYYARVRRGMVDGRYDSSQYGWRDAPENPILTLKDNTIPSNPTTFTITSGPKQVFLEWDWANGADADLSSVLVYKTGIPAERLNETSNYNEAGANYTWYTEDISGYFEANPEEYAYKLNPGTAFIDNDIQTGIFSGYGVDAGGLRDEPMSPVYYHYFLRAVDSSENYGVGLVSGVSSSPHVHAPNDKYAELPHTLGYVTGGGIDDSYLENIRAGKILTDRITANTFILANPSGRIVSDSVYVDGLNDPKFMFKGQGGGESEGVYIDHKMFRVGDPDDEGVFFTGEKQDGVYKSSNNYIFDDDGSLSDSFSPNTLEIRGNITAGTISIGQEGSNLHVDNQGNLSIGSRATEISGYFTGNLGFSGIETHTGAMQLHMDWLSQDEKDLMKNSSSTAFLEVNYIRGGDWQREVRGVVFVNHDSLSYGSEGTRGSDKLGYCEVNPPALNFSNEGSYGLSGVVTTGTTLENPHYGPRDYWRWVDVNFMVTNDGRLFAQNASIVGTVTANSFKANQTMILGEEGNASSSIIQSYGFRDSECSDIVNGWRIDGGGKAIFTDIEVKGGIISGASLAAGDCGQNDFFRVDTLGNISIGPSTNYKSLENNFWVSNEGDLFAINATVSGTISGSAGRIGGLQLTDTYISTFDTDTNLARVSLTDHSVTGLYLDRDGSFSISRGSDPAGGGNIIEYDASRNNDYIIITGLRSRLFDDSVTLDGKGQGFYIRGNQTKETSYISNFYTDGFSASGIAKQIDTQICGEIPYPLPNRKYHVISGSNIDYYVTSMDIQVNDGDDWSNDEIDIHLGGSQYIRQINSQNNYTIGITTLPEIDSSTFDNSHITLDMPDDTHGSDKICFNIGLRRK